MKPAEIVSHALRKITLEMLLSTSLGEPEHRRNAHSFRRDFVLMLIGSLASRPEAGRYLRVIYVPDRSAGSVFVITAYDLGDKALKALRRRLKPSTRKQS